MSQTPESYLVGLELRASMIWVGAVLASIAKNTREFRPAVHTLLDPVPVESSMAAKGRQHLGGMAVGQPPRQATGDRVGRMTSTPEEPPPSVPAPAQSAAVPYGTPDAPRIAVLGEAQLEVDPEIARIGVTVAARGKDRRSALDDLTRRNATVLELIKTYGEAVERLETGAFSITPELTEHGRGERVHAYHGRVRITAELADFTALGELTTRLADLKLTHVDGPHWALRPASPAHRRARQQAVREAVLRAREYAEALGTTLAALVELADIGAENAQPLPPAPGSMRAMAYATDTAASAAPLDLEPQRQRIYAQVNARFTMKPPKL